jgi:hypothetical protein
MADKNMNRRAALTGLFGRHPVLWILILALFGVSVLAFFITRITENLVQTVALEDAALYSQAIEEFRSVHTSEVVLTAREQGLEVSHDYQNKEHAIPLPATLSMLLGQRIGEHEAGAKTRLYSAYPFPWREEENKDIFGDPFARDAVLSVRGNRRPSFPQIRQSGPDAFGLLELSQYPSGYPQDRLEGRRRERRS